MSAHKQDNDETVEKETVDNDAVEDETTESMVEDFAPDQQQESQLDSPEKNADSLELQLEYAQAKATENWDQYLRAKAEIDNLRRRNVKDVQNAHKYGIEKFVNELLPVLDAMGMGLAAEDASAESLREGMKMTMDIMAKMMEKLGIEEIDPLNEKFDATVHQAMTMQPVADVDPNTVITVLQKGYALNQRLIRPAMVIVSKAVDE